MDAEIPVRSTPSYIERRRRLVCGELAVVALRALAGVGQPQAPLRVLDTAAHDVDRDGDGGASRFFRTRHQRPCDLPLVRRVELVPDRRAARSRYFLDACRGLRRKDLQVIASPRTAGDRDFAFRMERPVSGDRTRG